MIALASAALVLSLCSMGLNPVVFTARASACYELPANIRADDALRTAIAPLLARSKTLRRQCGRIAASNKTQVTLMLTAAPMSGRARSTARRYLSGLLIIDIEIPPASQDFAELLGHELEHVTEFIDGVDFTSPARTRDEGISESGSGGSFETARAQRGGRAAAAEVAESTDPAALAVGRGLVRGARATLGLPRRPPD